VSSGQISPTNGALLASDELVRPTEEDLCGQIPSQLTAKAALNRYGLKRKFLPARRHVAAASLALHHEGLPISGIWNMTAS